MLIPNSNGEDNRPLREFNPHHDPRGRFSNAGASAGQPGDYPPLHANGHDTQSRFSDGQGHYTPERQALHERIVESFMQGTTAVKRPVATILGGGPAAGKSTLVDQHGLGKKNTVEINADKIRERLPEWAQGLAAKDTAVSAKTHEEASDISKALMRAAAAGSRNAVFDGTGDSSLAKLAAKVSNFRDAGYRVEGAYVSLPVDLAVKLSNLRGQETGRYVPETYLRETHAAVSRTLPAAMRAGIFDRATLYDTTVKNQARRVASGGRSGKITIYNQPLWDTFLEKGKRP